MKKQKQILGLALFFMVCTGAYAQNNISVSNQFPQYMSLDRNNYAGNPQKLTFQYSEWINYTTLIDYYGEPSFSISIQMVSKHKPKGLTLSAEADTYKGFSTGDVGIPTGTKIVSKGAARVLIDNITTCYTGSGRGQGHRTVLHFTVPNYYIRPDTATYMVDVVFTLMQ
jgi:hypothetical protein